MVDDIQELKEKIGRNAERIIAQGMGLVRTGKKYHCPNVAAHKNGDKNPSMSWDSEALQFYCFTCGNKIDIYNYYKEYERLEHRDIMERCGIIENKKDSIKTSISKLTKKQVEYLLSRGILEETQNIFKLGNVNGNIAIPYFEFNKLSGIKYKNLKSDKPKYYSETGSKFGLLNKQNIIEKAILIITEGEFDAMIVYQSGFKNVVSIGTGANSLNELFQQEKSFLNSFNALIVLSDNDNAAQNMDKVFLKEFGYKVKLPNKKFYKDCKDMNEVFLKYGAEQIEKIINSASVKIEGLRNLDLQPYEGLEAIEGKYIPTGIISIDNALNDLSPGLVTLITGRSNGGKSTFVNQIMINAIDKGNKVLLIAGEGLQQLLINNIYKAVIGRDEKYFEYRQINKRVFKEPSSEALKALREWHKGKYTLFSKGESPLKTTDELFDLISMEIKINRHELVVIDNLMSVLSVERANEKLEKQADFMQRCCDLAKSEKIHIVLVLHPNKTVSKGSPMDFDQISGTQDLANKADCIIAVKRNYDEEDLIQGYDGEIEVLKNRYFSELPKVKTHFDKETGMLLEIDNKTGNYMAYSLKWKQYLK